jgi:hypothetical protein
MYEFRPIIYRSEVLVEFMRNDDLAAFFDLVLLVKILARCPVAPPLLAPSNSPAYYCVMETLRALFETRPTKPNAHG